ncbi:MAG TPA: tetratricopeptide repeat protein [Pyrinomonadaceae bacterium]|nr:tetratricopeptide repeat protein [Pyrinomonadaceae bacterium]
MQHRLGRIYCQRCLVANSVEQETCTRCGTRLMLVVEPSTLRFEEDSATSVDYEEHLLERVSVLENQLARLAEKLEQSVELLLRQTRSSYTDHTLLASLVETLGEAGAVNLRLLQSRWRERREMDTSKTEEKSRRKGLLDEILSRFEGPERELFARLVGDGLELFERGKATQGARALERAAALSRTNGPLNLFLGEHFFRGGRNALARDYLSLAHAADPEDVRVQLLLGIACGEEGEAARARELLVETLRRAGSSFAAHFSLGRLSAAESDWKTALAEFKRSLAARPCPEAHYMLGLANFQLERNRLALRHLTKAVEADPRYGEAFYLLGLVYRRLGERKRSGAAFALARELEAGEFAPVAAGKKTARAGRPERTPGAAAVGRDKRRLITGGDARLAAALREDALRGGPPR